MLSKMGSEYPGKSGHLPENLLDNKLSGGVFPLDGEPMMKTAGGGLSEHRPAGGAVGTNLNA